MKYASEKNPGVQQAIKAAGGIRALARLLGISAPTILEWRQIPEGRVLQVEALTGVSRETLRPDLYPSKETTC